MASKVMRGAPVYWKGKLIGEVNKADYEDNGNVSQEITTQGFEGNALGARVTSGSFDCSLFVEGMANKMHPQESGPLGFVTDGQQHLIDATIGTCKYSTDHASGKNSVSFSWTGGPPEIS